MRYRFLNHLNIVEVQRDVYMDVMLAQEAIDIFANRKIFVEADKVQPVQILRLHLRILR